MKFKYYAIFSLIFFIGIFIVIYSITSAQFDIGLGLALPVAAWITLIVVVFFIFSVLFLLGSWIKSVFVRKNNHRDFDTLVGQIVEQGCDDAIIPTKIKNTHLTELAKILARYTLIPNLESSESNNQKVDKVFATYKNIKMGVYEDLKKIQHNQTNQYALLNQKNYATKSIKNAFEILKDSSKDKSVRQFALNVIYDSKKEKDIQKAIQIAKDCLDKKSLEQFFKVCIELRIKLESSQIVEYCKVVGFDGNDYIQLARLMQSKLQPDTWVKIFSELANLDENAQKAYLFVLLELEMLTQATQEIKTYQNDNLIGICAYMDLKQAGKSYPLELFIK